MLVHFANSCHAQSDGKFCSAPGAGGGGKGTTLKGLGKVQKAELQNALEVTGLHDHEPVWKGAQVTIHPDDHEAVLYALKGSYDIEADNVRDGEDPSAAGRKRALGALMQKMGADPDKRMHLSEALNARLLKRQAEDRQAEAEWRAERDAKRASAS